MLKGFLINLGSSFAPNFKHYRKLFFGLVVCVLLGSTFIQPPIATALTVNPRLDLEADPGTTLQTSIKIINEERRTRTFYLRYQNFNAQDETGNPSFSDRYEDLASWIRTPESLTLGPGEIVEMPVQIEVPANADPGGHYAAIFMLSEPPNPNDEPGKVALGAKLGTLVLLRVGGDFIQNANILEFGTTNKQWFFSQLPIQFYYRFQNTGADHLKPVGDIQIINIFGKVTKVLSANVADGSVLPKSVRRFTSVWLDAGGDQKQSPTADLPEQKQKMTYWQTVNYQVHHFTMGRYTAKLKLVFGTKELKTDSANFVFYIIPWQLLVLVIPTVLPALIIWILILRALIKRYNRYIIRKAQRRQ